MSLNGYGTRSPLITSITGTAGQTAKVEFYIWNSPDSVPTTATLTASKPIPSENTLTVYFDASEYCRDYIAHTLFVPAVINTAEPVAGYCYLKTITYLNGVAQGTVSNYIMFDGYGLYTEGMNKKLASVGMTAGTYLVSDTGDVGNLRIVDDGVNTWTIEYRPLVEETPVTAVTLTQEVGQAPYIHPDFRGSGGNRIEVKVDGNVNREFTFTEVCEGKYDVYLCDFVNKFGAWQRLTFFKVSKENFSTTDSEYKVMPQNLPYSTSENRIQRFNVNGKESIKLNTGWVDESFSEVMKQLMLSETIRLNDIPVNITSKSSPMKKGINDKNINYEVSFMYSFDTINNVQ
jgi:hypothetical protein